MRERELQAAIVELAQALGYKVAHFRAMAGSDGRWRTPVAADGAGFPDLVLVGAQVLFVEVKAAKGRLSPAQVEWKLALIEGEALWFVWRPAAWLSGEVEATLRRYAP